MDCIKWPEEGQLMDLDADNGWSVGNTSRILGYLRQLIRTGNTINF